MSSLPTSSKASLSAEAAASKYTFGANLLKDGNTCFRLWAPAVKTVHLELFGHPPQTMVAQPDGFHELVCLAPAGTRYRFAFPDGSSVPDPASRLQDGDVHDASVVCDMLAYEWQHPQWKGRPWSETVLYEIHCGLAGGFEGVRAQLPHLAQLGITAVELMPVADFPGARNWGYDGVLPYAPDLSYGTSDELRRLIDTAHGLGLMVFLDVVYNHFGPDGNYLHQYAPQFFRSDLSTPWGPAIDFSRVQVRRFFAENALYWLREYRFDGLRLDAVHAISDPGWLPELADFVRGALGPDRYTHLVLENDNNAASLLGQGFDAQWNDDAHHVMHHVLTGEQTGYYASYVNEPTQLLARVLAEGFVFQGQADQARGGERRGEPSAGLSPEHFVFFLQNHDQVGNRAFGERLTMLDVSAHALQTAVALQLLTPQIPLLFMGEEQGAKTPFLYFTDHQQPALARAVREGRRNEFASFPAFAGSGARQAIPDPNELTTWRRSCLEVGTSTDEAAHWRSWYEQLLALRRRYITERLSGARSLGAKLIAPLAVQAEWAMGDGARLTLFCNLGEQERDCADLLTRPSQSVFFRGPNQDNLGSRPRAGCLPAYCVIASLEPEWEDKNASS